MSFAVYLCALCGKNYKQMKNQVANPTVSVIITTFNSSLYIRRTIDSILNQQGRDTEFKIELIVVDDQSTDNTKDIVSEYKEVIFLQNDTNSGGPNKGRNKGLETSTGDYICIVDHDDEWIPYKIREQLQHIHISDKYKIVTSNYMQVDVERNKEEIRGNKAEEQYIYHQTDETFLNKLKKNSTGERAYIGSILFHKSLKMNLFEEEYGMVDFDWMLSLFLNNASIEITKPLYRRYFYGSNLSLNENYRKNDYEWSMKTLSDYEKEYPDITAISKKRINGSMARYYYVTKNMKQARRYFVSSEINVKTILYYITSFCGYRFVRRYFNVFG